MKAMQDHKLALALGTLRIEKDNNPVPVKDVSIRRP